MDVTTIIDEVEEALRAQLALVAGDEAIAAAGDAIIAALAPALERATYHLAEQAAGEVDAQLPGRSVSVRLVEGSPTLVVEEDDDPVTVDTETLEARLTLRLSDQLKAVLEEVASESGDSVNTYVVKTLASKTRHRSTGRRFSGTIET